MKRFLLVGDINFGKSTLVYDMVGKADFSCGGVISIPVIKEGKKVGMDALDVMTGTTKELARMGTPDGISVGRYMISKEGLEHGKNAIYNAVGKCELVIIDEIGPLEMEGRGMARAAEYALKNGNTLVVIRRTLADRFIEKYGMYEFKTINANEIDSDELAKIVEKGLKHDNG